MLIIDCPGERRVRENRTHGVGGGGRKRADDARPMWIAGWYVGGAPLVYLISSRSASPWRLPSREGSGVPGAMADSKAAASRAFGADGREREQRPRGGAARRASSWAGSAGGRSPT